MACSNDALLGPAVRGCRNDFDFTVTFEQTVLNLLPASLFCLVSIVRIWSLFRRPRIVQETNNLRMLKLILASFYACLNLAVLLFTGIQYGRHNASIFTWSLVAATMNFAAALCLFALSSLEHLRSLRPSTIIGAYLFITVLFDMAQVRTAWLRTNEGDSSVYAGLLTATLTSKTAVLLVEAKNKFRWLTWDVKPVSPEETSGIYNLGVFLWLNNLFLKGYRGMLGMRDLYPLDTEMLSESTPTRFITKLRRDSSWRGERWGLPKAMLRALAWELSLPIIPRMVLLVSTLCQSFLIDALLRYLESTTEPPNYGYALIGATALTYSTIAVSTALYWYLQERFATLARSCLVLVIYEKATELQSGSGEGDSGVTTLMSTDVERIQVGIQELHEYWANLAQAAVASYFLKQLLGAAFTVPIVVVIIATLTSAVLGKLMGSRQRAWMAAIQSRVSVTADAIAQMKLIKMAGMANPVQNTIQALRMEELAYGSHWRLVVAAAAIVSHVQGLIAPVLTFAVTSKTLDTSSIFVSLSYLTLLTTPLVTLLQKLPQLLGALTCLRRIQEFLEREAKADYRCSRTGRDMPVLELEILNTPFDAGIEMELFDMSIKFGATGTQRLITVEEGSFGWDEDHLIFTHVDFTIPKSKLTIISGTVASGKSTLCKVLLGEVPFASGKVTIPNRNMRVGYCDQQPFLFNTSIRENIIGHGHFDAQRYGHVLQATKLNVDLGDLSRGDATVIGNGGIILSGGQRQRVAIARALYAQGTDLLIFDDVLSGLDAGTEDDVFRNVFGPQGWIRRHALTAVLCTHNIRRLVAADHLIRINEEGAIVEEDQTPKSAGDSTTDDNAMEELNVALSQLGTTSAEFQRADHTEQRNSARQAGDWSIYKYYFKTAGAVPCLVFLIASASNGFFNNFPRIWLTFWSNDAARGAGREHGQTYYIGIYGLLQALYLLSFVVALVTVLHTIIRRSGAKLHERALRTVIYAPLRFYTTTDTGLITNYFSQDITLIDGELPLALINMLIYLFSVLGLAAVIASSSPWLALSYPGIAVVLWLLQRFYLRTSRQLRLLDLEAKSPLYSHFLDTVKGLASIRAFGWTSHHIAHNRHLLDESQRPAYLLRMAQRWLYFWLSVVVTIIATCLVALTTQLRAASSLSGASLTALMTLSESLRDLVRFYAALETSIGAVARLRSFTSDTPSEQGPKQTEKPQKGWPQEGILSIHNVSASYTDGEDDDVLRDLDLEIQAGEKVAICGRTGSGKSSSVLLLLGLLEPVQRDTQNQNLSIDGLQLPTIDRQRLREQLITVPQDPVFLPRGSTIARNLDPLEAATTEQCQTVLQDLDLWDVVKGLGGLKQPLREDSLSHGQRQLFCLARAVLKRRVYGGAILLLDEFTSAVDKQMEHRMLEVVRREFQGCTVILVAHRLDMVMDFCDRVVVIDGGRVVETGNPRVLCRLDGTWFSDLLARAGHG